ncbi:MAG: molybdopterin molybdenumtransferase MoeA, partial [Deltaproteobacteria bacterium]|nr:molybdopterin molybdenumtransferase MoeA [Deltaproteobacteria bacterium]
MLSVAEALRAVLDRVAPLDTVSSELDAACGAVLAEPIVATRASPGFDNSAMDGYAVRAADLPGTLPIAATVFAGTTAVAPIPAGTAIRIFTGAPLPPELDTVVIQEDATREGDRVTLPAARAGDHIRRMGEDIAIGDTVLAAGVRLRPWDLGVLAALGVARVPV